MTTDHDANAAQREDLRAAMYVLVSGIVMFGAVALCASRVLKAFDTGQAGKDRFQLILDEIPELQPHPVIMLGSSLVVFGFSPFTFDQRLRDQHHEEATSYNLGCLGVTPELLRLLAKQLRLAYASSSAKPEEIFVEFTPHMATKRMVVASNEPQTNSQRALPLIDLQEFGHQVMSSSSAAGHTLALWALGGRPAGGATATMKDWLFRPVFNDPPNESDRKRIEELTETKEWKAVGSRRAAESSAWRRSTRGGRIELSLAERTVISEYQRLLSPPAELAKEKQWLIDTYDAIDLEFDDRMVEEFIDGIGELRKLTSAIHVIVFPRPSWMGPSAIGSKRLEAVLRRISERSGVPIWNFFSAPEFGPGEFLDSAHLNEGGAIKLSTMLADRYAVEKAKLNE